MKSESTVHQSAGGLKKKGKMTSGEIKIIQDSIRLINDKVECLIRESADNRIEIDSYNVMCFTETIREYANQILSIVYKERGIET